MTKNFVIDTNILLYDPNALDNFGDNNIWIPVAVIEELDTAKKFNDEVGCNARTVSSMLDGFSVDGRMPSRVVTDGGGELSITDCEHRIEGMSRSNDARIIGAAIELASRVCGEVVLVTRDKNMRILARHYGVKAQDYRSDRVDVNNLGKINHLELPSWAIDMLYEAQRSGSVGSLPLENVRDVVDHSPAENSCYVASDGHRSALVRFKRDGFVALRDRSDVYGITPRNSEQRFLLDMLLDRDVKLVLCSGVAGSGKTLLSMAAGLHEVSGGAMDRSGPEIMLITKAIMPFGNDIGYVPGDKNEKMAEWIKPFYDNLELLLRKRSRDIQKMFDDGTIEVDALTYIRGRSLMRRWIIVDECQNLSRTKIKTIISRMADSSKLILLGDFQQIDDPSLTASSNGQAYAMERLGNIREVGILNMTRSERGTIARMAVERL